ncbi:MAG: sporulation protein YabP [Firmicutes bacterium]|nr:sporulation protein YabP [Bacillota bacterium]
MSEEKKNTMRHSIYIEERERISISGVLDVLSFDEENIYAETELGLLHISGSSLHVNKLNLDLGDLAVDGDIGGVEYSESFSKPKESIMSRLFK